MTSEEQQELRDLRALQSIVLEGSFHVVLNMNDTFGWACSDAEEMPVEDIVHMVPLFQQYGHDAINAYAAVKRDCDAMDHPQVRTQKYWDAKEKIKVLKANIPYFCEYD